MFDLKITHKDGRIECSTFKTLEELNAYDLSVYGEEKAIIPEYEEIDVPESIIHHDAELDAEGNVLKESYDEVVPAIYKTIPEQTIVNWTKEIIDRTLEYRVAELINSGGSDRLVCNMCLSLIGGYNKERLLTAAQIQSMAISFSNIDFCLSKGMPKTAKALIAQVATDEIVTDELKALLLEVLKAY